MSKETKPGLKTSEFYLVAIQVILLILGVVFTSLNPTIAAIVSAVLVTVYVIGRDYVKRTPATWDDKALAEIGKFLEKIGKLPK